MPAGKISFRARLAQSKGGNIRWPGLKLFLIFISRHIKHWRIFVVHFHLFFCIPVADERRNFDFRHQFGAFYLCGNFVILCYKFA